MAFWFSIVPSSYVNSSSGAQLHFILSGKHPSICIVECFGNIIDCTSQTYYCTPYISKDYEASVIGELVCDSECSVAKSTKQLKVQFLWGNGRLSIWLALRVRQLASAGWLSYLLMFFQHTTNYAIERDSWMSEQAERILTQVMCSSMYYACPTHQHDAYQYCFCSIVPFVWIGREQVSGRVVSEINGSCRGFLFCLEKGVYLVSNPCTV